MNELITKNNEWIIHFMSNIDRLLDGFEHLTANYRPTLGGERFFTDKEVSARLKVSRRTLQDYRNEGRIPYIQLGGKHFAFNCYYFHNLLIIWFSVAKVRLFVHFSFHVRSKLLKIFFRM